MPTQMDCMNRVCHTEAARELSAQLHEAAALSLAATLQAAAMLLLQSF